MSEDREEQFARFAPPGEEAAPSRRQIDIVSAADLSERDVPTRCWHVDGMIPAGTVTSLYGDGGTGKSLVALQLAIATVTATAWLGHQVEIGPVIFLTAEDDIDELHRRLSDICHADGLDLGSLKHLSIIPLGGEDAVLAAPTRTGTLKATALYDALTEAVEMLRPRLIVLDTLADLFGGNEVDRAQVRQFIGLLRGIAIRYDTTVLLLGHPSLSGMSTGSGSSGSTAWNNSVRSRLYLRRVTSRDGDRVIEEDPDVRTLDTVKTNYGRTGNALTLKWDRGRFVPHGSTADARMGLTIADAQGRVDRIFLKLLAAYAAEGRDVSPSPSANFAPARFAQDARSEGVGKAGLNAAMNRLLASGCIAVEEIGPASRRTKRLVVARSGNVDRPDTAS